jgi:hypothetical protein
MQHVNVYRNLTRKCLSIKHKGLVRGHAQRVYLTGGVQFTVRPGTRDRVRATGKKEVHAWVSGLIYARDASVPAVPPLAVRARYNPKRDDTWHVDGRPVLGGSCAWVDAAGEVWVLDPVFA